MCIVSMILYFFLTLFPLVSALVPFPLQLPAKLVVRPVVHELAAVAEAAEAGFLVVLADVGSVVPARGGAQVGWRPHWSLPVDE